MYITRVCVTEGLIQSAAVFIETGCVKRRRCKNGSNLHRSTHLIDTEFNSRKPHHDGAQAEQPGHRSQQDEDDSSHSWLPYYAPEAVPNLFFALELVEMGQTVEDQVRGQAVEGYTCPLHRYDGRYRCRALIPTPAPPLLRQTSLLDHRVYSPKPKHSLQLT